MNTLPSDHYIYVIGTLRPRVAAPIKVGITRSPRTRLATLQTASSTPIAFAFVLQTADQNTARFLEKDFHDHHPDRRTNGEWFDVTPHAAGEWLCDRYRMLLETGIHHGAITREDAHLVIGRCGIYAVEQKLAAERYLSAWESLGVSPT